MAKKYIDADLIRQEIERRRLHLNKEAEKYQALNNGYSQNCYGARDALRDLENFIDSLQQEQPSEDLKEEIDSFWNKASGFSPKFTTLEVKRNGLGVIASHFANWQKEQMMKDAWEREVKIDSGGYPYIDITAELYDYEHDVPLAKRGELVKIIIVKEDKE